MLEKVGKAKDFEFLSVAKLLVACSSDLWWTKLPPGEFHQMLEAR